MYLPDSRKLQIQLLRLLNVKCDSRMNLPACVQLSRATSTACQTAVEQGDCPDICRQFLWFFHGIIKSPTDDIIE